MLLQSTPDNRPTGQPAGRGHLPLIPSHLLQLSQTSDPPAVTCAAICWALEQVRGAP